MKIRIFMSGEIALIILGIIFIGMAILYLMPVYYFFVIKSSFKFIQPPLKKSVLISLAIIFFNILFYSNKNLIPISELNVIESNEHRFIFLGLFYFCLPFFYLHIFRKRNPKIRGYWIAFTLSFLAYNANYLPQKMMGDRENKIISYLQKGNIKALETVWGGRCPNSYNIQFEFFNNKELIKTFDRKSLLFLTECFKKSNQSITYNGESMTDNYPLFYNEFSWAEWHENIIELFVSKEFYDTLRENDKKEIAKAISRTLQGDLNYEGDFENYTKKIDYVFQQQPEFKSYIVFDKSEFELALRNSYLKYAHYLRKHLDVNDPTVKLGLAIIDDDVEYVIRVAKQEPKLFTQIIADSTALKSCEDGDRPFDMNIFIFSSGSKELVTSLLDNNLVNITDYQCIGYNYLAGNLGREKTCYSYLLRFLDYNYIIKNKEDKKELEKRISSQVTQCDV